METTVVCKTMAHFLKHALNIFRSRRELTVTGKMSGDADRQDQRAPNMGINEVAAFQASYPHIVGIVCSHVCRSAINQVRVQRLHFLARQDVGRWALKLQS